MDASVAVVGCSSGQTSRTSCELDVLIVGADPRPPVSLKLGGAFVDLAFVTEKEVLRPPDPEHAVALASAKPVRDASMALSAASSAAAALLSESCGKSATKRLASALKAVGRADEALQKEATAEADLWLLAGAYDFAYAFLYSKEEMPSPSHIFSQMKSRSASSPAGFEAFCAAAGLEKTSRAACASRLEGVAVLSDLLAQVGSSSRRPAQLSNEGLAIVRAKADELGARMEHAECYSFLGLELVGDVLSIPTSGRRGKRKGAGLGPDVGSLLTGEGRLLGESLAADVGLTRTRESIKSAAGVLEAQISALAKVR